MATIRLRFSAGGTPFDLFLSFAGAATSGSVTGITGTAGAQTVTGKTPVNYNSTTQMFDGASISDADDVSFVANGVYYNFYGTSGGNFLVTSNNGAFSNTASSVPVVSSANVPEIAILGNAVTIVDGDTTPSATDHTVFGSQDVASGTITRTFTIQNTGQGALSVGAITIGGANAGDFTVTTPPASSVATGGSTTFVVTFDPSATGTRSATISVANNDDDENPYNFAISGFGGGNTPPAVNNNLGLTLNEGSTGTITAARLDFNDAEQADGLITYTVTSAATNGTLFRSGVALGVGGTFTQTDINNNLITYTHNSSETTAASFGFSVTDGTATVSNQTFNFTVNPVADVTTRVQFTANGVAFDLVLTFALGNGSGSVTDISGTAGGQTVTGLTPVAYNGTSQTFDGAPYDGDDDVSFVANGVYYNVYGAGSGLLVTSNNGAFSNTQTSNVVVSSASASEIAIRGNAIEIVDGDTTPSATDHTAFGTQDVASGTITRTFTIENTGNDTLSVGAITIGGANAGDFTVTTPPASSVATGGSTTFVVTFDPSATGTRNATISVVNGDATENPYNFSISGIGGVNTPPTVNNNLGLTLNEGSTGTITAARLDFNDAEQADGLITYTVTSAATNGTLFRNGVALGVGGTFTQADINSNLITYTHNSSETSSASFGFSVTDSAATVSNQTFTFTVNPVADLSTRVQFTANGVAFDLVLTFADGSGSGTVTGISGTAGGQTVTGLTPVAYNGTSQTFDGAPYDGDDDVSFVANGVYYNVYGAGSGLLVTSNNGAFSNTATSNPTVSSAPIAEIAIQGNAIEIVDGDTTPSATDHTAFGTQDVASGTITRTFTIVNAGADTLSVGAITIGGANAGDFTVTTPPASSVAVGGSTAFSVTFNPSASGARNATISVVNGDADENPYNFSISGTGTVNTAPTLGVNAGSTVAEGGTDTITAAELDFNDAEQADGTITYTVTTGVTNGTLSRTVGGISTPLLLGDSFTQDDINNGRITFAHDGGETTGAFFGFSVSDGAGGTVTGQSFAFTVAPVNDAPTVAAPASVSVTEDVATAVTGISFSDVDAGSGSVTATFSVASGTVAASSGGNVTVGGSATALTLSGTVADINAFIAASNLSYRTAQDATAGVQLDVSINDGGNTGSGGAKSGAGSTSISVNAVNDAPTLAATGLSPTFSEGSGAGVQGSAVDLFGSVTASTVESGQTVTGLTFTVSGLSDGSSETVGIDGTAVALMAGTSGTTGANGVGYAVTVAGGVATVVLTSASGLSEARAAALVEGLSYQNTNLDNPTAGTRVVTLTGLTDSGGGSDTGVLSIASTVTVTAVDDPATGGVTGTLSVAETSGNGTVVGSLSITDPDTAYTFSLASGPGNPGGDAGGRFTIVGNQVRVADGLLLDFEQATSHTIHVVATPVGGGAAIEADLVVSLTDVAPETITGDGRANTFVAGAGADRLDGGVGADLLRAGAGDDTYVIDDAGDVVDETGASGTDTVRSSVISISLLDTVHLKGEIENAALDGSLDLNLTGNSSANELTGNAGANRLDGRGGGDMLRGLSGNDTYIVRNAADVVQEAAGGGTDTVSALVSYVLTAGAAVEILDTGNGSGTGTLNLTGNALGQSVTGNDGANRLDGGGGGGDVLAGRDGNDTYIIRSGSDVVQDAAGKGIDTVSALVSYTLTAGASIEAMDTGNASGTGAINLKGNEFEQAIDGNAGANRLDGGANNDRLRGFGGDDTYIVDDARDVVIEAAGQGTDTVSASVSYALQAGVSVEKFDTGNGSGTGTLNLTGNALAQSITGNDGANRLDGGGGGDTLAGRDGSDTYIVRAANDIIQEAAGKGTDTVSALVSYTLTAGAAVEALNTGNGSGTGTLDLSGNEVGQEVSGNAGINRLDGKGGLDVLRGFGSDDTFVFSTAPAAGNVDTILDFAGAVGNDDRIELSTSAFGGLAVGQLSNTLFAANASGTAQDSDDRIIYNTATGALIFDSNGNGAGGDVQFATLSGAPALANTDFFVV